MNHPIIAKLSPKSEITNMSQDEKAARTLEIQQARAFKLWAWIGLQVVLPCFVIVVVWLAMEYLFDVHFAFEKSFIGADTVLIGAMLLTTLVVEIRSEERLMRRKKHIATVDRLWLLSVLFTFVAILCFGLLKAKSIQYDFPTIPTQLRDQSARNCVTASIAIGIFFVICGTVVALFAHKRFLEEELNA